MSNLTIHADRLKPGFTVLRLKGEFEGMALEEGKGRLLTFFAEQGAKEIFIDFGEISYIDSSAIGVLLEVAQTAQASNIRFGLMNVAEPIRKVIEITKLDKIIKIY